MPCNTCPKRSACREICPKLEAELPKIRDRGIPSRRDIEKAVLDIETQRRVTRMVLELRDLLPPREREVIDLTLNNSLSINGLAFQMEISRNAAYGLVRRARRRLAQIIRKKGKAVAS